MGWDKPTPIGDDSRPTMHGSRPKREMAKWGGQVMRLTGKNHSPQTKKGPKGKGKK